MFSLEEAHAGDESDPVAVDFIDAISEYEDDWENSDH